MKRSAGGFLQGLRLLLDRTPMTTPITVTFQGAAVDEKTLEKITTLNLHSLVCIQPAVSRREVFSLMYEKYVLLLIANDQPYQIPAKLYEYLAVGRRIIAVTEHDSATADFLQGRHGCIVAETPEEIANALDIYWQEWTEGKPPEINNSDFLRDCHYEQRTTQLAELIARVASTSKNRTKACL